MSSIWSSRRRVFYSKLETQNSRLPTTTFVCGSLDTSLLPSARREARGRTDTRPYTLLADVDFRSTCKAQGTGVSFGLVSRTHHPFVRARRTGTLCPTRTKDRVTLMTPSKTTTSWTKCFPRSKRFVGSLGLSKVLTLYSYPVRNKDLKTYTGDQGFLLKLGSRSTWGQGRRGVTVDHR